jgi:pyridoxine 5-phosphate synthase
VAALKSAGMAVSAFIDPDAAQIEAAARAGFGVCEVHTGTYAHAFKEAAGDLRNKRLWSELEKVADAGRRIQSAGMQFNAGHALNYVNVRHIAALPDIRELHIGHAIVSRAVFVGLRAAVREMKMAMAGK